jgi:biopolymer transport protein ExbD
MKRKTRRGNLVPEVGLNMTPMIDCVFLLLIFFMITTVFLDVKGIVVDLPGAADSQNQEQQQKKDVNIQVSANGEYTVNGEIVSSSSLASAIKGAMDINNNKNVIIHGDPQAEQKYIVYAMDMAQGEGAEGMAFAVEEQQK